MRADRVALLRAEPLQQHICPRVRSQRVDALDVGVGELDPLHAQPPARTPLGRRAPLAVTIGLFLQYLLLAHGGYTTLGLNASIVGVPAVLAGQAYPVLRRVGLSAFARGAILGGAAAAGAVALNFLVLLVAGKEDWATLAKLVLLAHVPIVILEALMLGVIVRYVEKVKPEMLPR